MEPNSPLLLVLLLLAAVGLVVLLVLLARGRIRAVARWPRPVGVATQVVSGGLALSLALAAGIVIVNDYYGYYQSWSQLGTDLSGQYDTMPLTAVAASNLPQPTGGRIESVQMPGAHSGINRPGLVYLPPQYFEAKYAHTYFPALELLHGTPGSPSTWVLHLQIASIEQQLIGRRLMGPVVLVMPTMSVGTDYQECVDAPGALDDTYITEDVRADVEAHFRVSRDAAQWGVGGYSSGGYCAANLALRHPAAFGASAIMDGYFRPQDGPAAKALHYNAAAEQVNDPLREATIAGRRGGPLPAFWLSYGAGNQGDYVGVKNFTTALDGVEAVSVYQVPAAGHNFYAWEPAIPFMLQWMWTELAPPDLRVQFPIAGPVTSNTIDLSRQLLAAARAAAAKRRPLARLSPSGAPVRTAPTPRVPGK